MASSGRTARETILAYRNNWTAFAVDVLGVTMHDTLEEFLVAVQNHKFIWRVGCFDCAKTYDAAIAGLCYLFTRDPSKLITTSTSGRQVKKQLWSYINEIYEKSKVPLGGRCLETELKIAADHWGLGFAADKYNENAQQGWHSPNLMLITDEACGVPPMVFNLYKKVVTSNRHKFVTLANAVDANTEFGRCEKDPKFKKIRTTAFDCINVKRGAEIIPGMVTNEWVEERADEYPPGSEMFEMMVNAKFPLSSEHGLIPTQWVTAAFDRWLLRRDEIHTGNNIEGVDIAKSGRDETIKARKTGTYLRELDATPSPDLHQLENDLEAEYLQGWTLCVDVAGIGAAVGDNLRSGRNIPVIEVVGSQRSEATDKSGMLGFVNKRSELWWSMREALNPLNGGDDPLHNLLALPPDDLLLQDLTAPDWSIAAGGKIKVEPKEKVVEKLGRSPDRGDALANTFAAPTEEIHLLTRDELQRISAGNIRKTSNLRAKRTHLRGKRQR